MKFIRDDIRIINGEHHPIDMNDREHESTAIEYSLPEDFCTIAKDCWNYFEGSAYIFEYKDKLVVTDESLWLTEYGGDTPESPYGAPRWECDTWKELELSLKSTYYELKEQGEI